jgi:hypothetical protein
MNSSHYFNYIEEKINTLGHRIAIRGKLNILDLNIYSETFFTDLLNLILNWELRNMNIVKQNVEGIDLIDDKNKIVAQVSATSTKQKINSSLEKSILSEFSDYRFKFVAIANDVKDLKNKKYTNPHNIKFDANDDIIGIVEILKIILNMNIDKQKDVYKFIKKELGSEIDILKVDTNLAVIIGILASENLGDCNESPEINMFQIERKIEFNELSDVRDTIDDFKIYYHKLDEKYSEFNKEGTNKSLSVLNLIKSQYRKIVMENDDKSIVFYKIIDKIIEIISKSKNYIEIPYEELELCVYIIVVDAFIRCKIFENPEGYSHVIAR